MDTITSPPQQPPAPASTKSDPSRTAALWVGATGAFLILAAMGVLVAVRWDEIGESAKVGGMVAGNAALVWAGLRLRRTLPATATTLFHLGALLIPVTVAAGGLLGGLGWESTLLVTSVLGGGAIGALRRVEPSWVLGWAERLAVVAGCGGIAAVSDAPAGVLVASLAVVAAVIGARTNAVAWAWIAALLPLVELTERQVLRENEVLRGLGLVSDHPWQWTLVVGGLAATALGWIAVRRADERMAIGSLVVAGVSALSASVHVDPTLNESLLAVASAIVLAQLAAWALGRDPAFGAPLRVLAGAAEVALGVITAGAFVNTAFAVIFDLGDPPGLDVSIALLAVAGWFVADIRRRVPDCQRLGIALLVGGGHLPSTVGIVAASMTAAWLGTSPIVAGFLVVAIGAAAAVSGRPGAALAVGLATVFAVAPLGDERLLWTGIIGGLAVLLVTGALALRGRVHPDLDLASAGLGLAGVIASIATAMAAPELLGPTVFFAAATLVALGAERLGSDPLAHGRGLLPRVAAFGAFLTVPWFDDPALILLSVVATWVGVVDWMRTGDARLALPVALLSPALVGSLLVTAELSLPYVGVAMVVAAVTVAGAQLSVRTWLLPALVTIGSLTVTGLGLAAAEPSTMSTALLILGGAVVMGSLITRSVGQILVGGGLATVGLYTRLVLLGIDWSEAYLAPLALLALIAGAALRHERLASWWAYGPSIVLLAGAGVFERLGGGSAWHSVIAGAVGVVAVAVGGRWRLAGPLFLGTGTLVVVTVIESLGYAASVPAWVWLALGGTALLAVAVAIERNATSPAETGRRMVATLRRSFS